MTALGYILAAESNARTNDRKADFVKRTSYGLFVATAGLTVLLGTVAYLHLVQSINS